MAVLFSVEEDNNYSLPDPPSDFRLCGSAVTWSSLRMMTARGMRLARIMIDCLCFVGADAHEPQDPYLSLIVALAACLTFVLVVPPKVRARPDN
jgi:hypothetical protein